MIVPPKDKHYGATMPPIDLSPTSKISGTMHDFLLCSGTSARPPNTQAPWGQRDRSSGAATWLHRRTPRLYGDGRRPDATAVMRAGALPNMARGARSVRLKCRGADLRKSGAPNFYSPRSSHYRTRTSFLLRIHGQSIGRACYDLAGLPRPKPNADSHSTLSDPQQFFSPCGKLHRPHDSHQPPKPCSQNGAHVFRWNGAAAANLNRIAAGGRSVLPKKGRSTFRHIMGCMTSEVIRIGKF
jgi:hypothetical protein